MPFSFFDPRTFNSHLDLFDKWKYLPHTVLCVEFSIHRYVWIRCASRDLCVTILKGRNITMLENYFQMTYLFSCFILRANLKGVKVITLSRQLNFEPSKVIIIEVEYLQK